MYLLLGFILSLVARLPWRVLYLLSDLMFILLYHIVRYRRGLVLQNLTEAFPDKDSQEINRIRLEFYHNFCDQVLETIKLMRATPEEISARFDVDTEVYDKLYGQGRHVLQATAHQFNWEWGNWILNLHTSFHVRIIYMIMLNPKAEALANSYRTRYGSEMVPANDLRRLTKLPPKPSMTVFLGDQNPSSIRRAYWTQFFGRNAPFHRGLEILARRTGAAVVFDQMIKVKRGYYKSVSTLAFENPEQTTDNEITEKYVRFLENSISQQPENWLWTHNRWKRKQPDSQ